MEGRKVLDRLAFLINWARMNDITLSIQMSGRQVEVHPSLYSFKDSPGKTIGPFVGEYPEGKEVHLLDAQELQKAELLEVVLEEKYTKRATFQVSPRLGQLLGEAFDKYRREDIKATADHVLVNVASTHELVRGMRLADQVAGLKNPVVAAFSGSTVLFFKCSEDEAVKKLEALREIVRTPTPRKVLVKMVALRMSKLLKELRKENERRGRNREADVKGRAEDPNWRGIQTFPDIPVPDFTSPISMRAAAGRFAKDSQVNFDLCKAGKELVKTFSKDGVDDAIIQEAGNQASVEEVMTM